MLEQKISSRMLIIVVVLILVVLSAVNVKTIILNGFGDIIIFRIFTIIFLVVTIALNLISAFLYVSVMNAQTEAIGRFKAANILFLIGLCVSIILLILNQCCE